MLDGQYQVKRKNWALKNTRHDNKGNPNESLTYPGFDSEGYLTYHLNIIVQNNIK